MTTKSNHPTIAARSSDPLHAAATEMHDTLARLVRLVQFRDRNRICCHDISVTQAYAMEVILRGSSITLNQLASALYLDKSTTSRVVDALERKGYVSRRVHPEDGRAVILRVTAAGRRLHQRIRDSLVAETETLLREVEPEAWSSVTRLIANVADRIAGCSGVKDPGSDAPVSCAD